LAAGELTDKNQTYKLKKSNIFGLTDRRWVCEDGSSAIPRHYHISAAQSTQLYSTS